MQIIPQPLTGVDLFDRQPGPAVSQGQKEVPAVEDGGHDDDYGSPGGSHALALEAFLGGLEAVLDPVGHFALQVIFLGQYGFVIDHRLHVEDELDQCARHQARAQVGGQIVVQEQLAAHNVEGEIVRRPAEEEEASAVVEARAGS